MQLYHTFISYSRADGEFALKLANDLRVAGVNIWLDQLDIPPGARWDRAVEDALETCGRLLIILSPTSADSENVQDEIGVAFDNNKPIVPILCKPCDVPMRLRRLQYIDFTKDYEQGLKTLLTVMKLPVTAPEGGAATAASASSAGAGQAGTESKPGYTASPPPEAKPASSLMSRRNLLIALGGAALVVLLIWIFSGDSGTDDAEGTSQPVAAASPSAATQESPAAGEVPCESASKVHSAREETGAASITITNHSDEALSVYWIDYDGKQEKYDALPPDKSVSYDSYKGHFWLVKDPQGKCLKLYEAPGSFVIE